MPEIKNIRYNNRAATVTAIIKNAERVLDSSITQFVEGTPIECNYYSYDNDLSTVGVGFLDDDGPFSGARKYNFIKDYIMYGYNDVKELTKEEKDEIDITVEMASNSSLHLPNTIQPKEGDLLTLHIENNAIFYVVVKAEPATLHNKSFWKIEWNKCENLPSENYSHRNMELDGLINQVYKFVPEHVGTDYTCFLKTDFYDKIVYLKNQRYDINNMYNDYFYDEYRNVLLVDNYNMDGSPSIYIPIITDLQMEFKPLYIYDGFVNMVLHIETITNKRTRLNWRRSPLRLFLQEKNTSILNKGLECAKSTYITNVDYKEYKLQSYLNDDRVYYVYSYGEGEVINIPDNFMDTFERFAMDKLSIDYFMDKFKEHYFDIDITKEYLLYTPVFLHILDSYIASSIANEKIDRFY